MTTRQGCETPPNDLPPGIDLTSSDGDLGIVCFSSSKAHNKEEEEEDAIIDLEIETVAEAKLESDTVEYDYGNNYLPSTPPDSPPYLPTMYSDWYLEGVSDTFIGIYRNK